MVSHSTVYAHTVATQGFPHCSCYPFAYLASITAVDIRLLTHIFYTCHQVYPMDHKQPCQLVTESSSVLRTHREHFSSEGLDNVCFSLWLPIADRYSDLSAYIDVRAVYCPHQLNGLVPHLQRLDSSTQPSVTREARRLY